MKVQMVIEWSLGSDPERRYDVQIKVDSETPPEEVDEDTVLGEELCFRDQYATSDSAVQWGTKAFKEAIQNYYGKAQP